MGLDAENDAAPLIYSIMVTTRRKCKMLKQKLKIFLSATPLILLFGCAPPAYVMSEPVSIGSLGSKTTIIIEDLRPESDRDRSIGSLLVTSDDYGIWTIGDQQFSPPILDLLKINIAKTTAKLKKQPKTIKVKLKRLIIQANHQADLLQSVSSSQTPLAAAIAESMHGKKFEMDINKTKPYIIGFIESEVEIYYSSKNKRTKKLSLSKANNFRSHVDEEGRKKSSMKVVKDLLAAFSKSIF